MGYEPFKLRVPGTAESHITRAVWESDIEYLRSRVLTHRNSKAETLDATENRYYEAMRTLLDALDYTHRHVYVECLKTITINVDPDDHRSKIEVIGEIVPGEGFFVEFIYTVDADHPLGEYVITAVAIGEDSYWKEIPVIRIPAGERLRYSENFPIPSELVHLMNTTMNAMAAEAKERAAARGEGV